jgi:DNA modification methylase
LLGIPWRVAFALQEDGWWLRSDIIWAKPNPMPESVTDRPTRSHEYIFLLSKSARYWYDAYAIAEPAANPFDLGLLRGRSFVDGANVAWHAPSIVKRQEAGVDSRTAGSANRNKRDVWTITTAPYPNAHFATFPPKLIEPCILAGAPAGGVVLDPFAGAGTTLLVAKNLNRQAVGIELSPDYCGLIVDRLQQDVLPLAVLHDD